jgi:SAM-dependent methyltransferase
MRCGTERSEIGGLNTIKIADAYRQVLYCPRCKKVLKLMSGEYFCPSCARSYPVIDGIPSFVDTDLEVTSFDASGFGFLAEMERKHFWHIGRREMILDILKRNVPHLAESKMLEIGCGNGNILAYLKENGINIEGGDIFLEGLKFYQRKLDNTALYQIDIMALPFHHNFDIIGMFDILEHIDEDEKALAEVSQALKSGGRILIMVPAHKFLWSYFDILSCHRRRYDKDELKAKLERNGFVIKKMTYYMFFLFPLLTGIRLIGNITRKASKKQASKASLEVSTIPIVNKVFLGLLRLERYLIRYLNLPLGASLLVLAEKPNE